MPTGMSDARGTRDGVGQSRTPIAGATEYLVSHTVADAQAIPPPTLPAHWD